MTFAEKLNSLNESYFFREFTYSKSTFHPRLSQEFELADSILQLGDFLVVYQLKEREINIDTTAEAEKRWYENKVLRKATRQIRNTLEYLNSGDVIEIPNHRHHHCTFDIRSIRTLHKLIVYLSHEALPEDCRQIKHHRSRTAGMIHIIAANDYLRMIRTLLTPAEVIEYLNFREVIINKWEACVLAIPEQALVGQYLCGDSDTAPSLDFIDYLRSLNHRADEWDMSGIISKFPERITTANKPTEYYPIVRELALLKRNALREFKTRFQLSMEKTRADVIVRPYRMAIPQNCCGFVFIPVTKELLIHRRNALQNFTLAHKYEQKLAKCIGVSIADDADGWFTVEWSYAEFPWKQDPQLDELLSNDYPFREVKPRELSRYTFM